MELLVDEKSALTKTNLRALILDPEVWKLLSPEQVAEVQKYWPGDSYNGDLSALASNDHLRHDIAQYQKALADGQHDAEWIKQAKEANKLRNERLDAEAAQTGKNESGSEDDPNGKSEAKQDARTKGHGKKIDDDERDHVMYDG
ncbi:putative ASX DEUBAD domain-containing protein [Seiridium cardinale]|uniref:ASX DEUBAD domain-containing protein n=1 Tax=Seiridium cardinale TaxID=138064 RepID=A0ABR2XVU2_9PEZI